MFAIVFLLSLNFAVASSPNLLAEDPFEFFGLDPKTATLDEATMLRRDLARTYNVDTAAQNGIDTTEIMQAINAMFSRLVDLINERDARRLSDSSTSNISQRAEGRWFEDFEEPLEPARLIPRWVRVKPQKTKILSELTPHYDSLSDGDLLAIIREDESMTYISLAYDELLERDQVQNLPKILRIVRGHMTRLSKSPHVVFANIQNSNDEAVLNFLTRAAFQFYTDDFEEVEEVGILLAQALIDRLDDHPELFAPLMQLAWNHYDEMHRLPRMIISSLREYSHPEILRFLLKASTFVPRGSGDQEFYQERHRSNQVFLRAMLMRQDEPMAARAVANQIKINLDKVRRYLKYSKEEIGYSEVIFRLNLTKATETIKSLVEAMQDNHHPAFLQALAEVHNAGIFRRFIETQELQWPIKKAVRARAHRPDMQFYLRESAVSRRCRRLLRRDFWIHPNGGFALEPRSS